MLNVTLPGNPYKEYIQKNCGALCILVLWVMLICSPVFAGVVVIVDDVPGNDSTYVPGVGGNISGATAVQMAVAMINSDTGQASYTINMIDTDGVQDTYQGRWEVQQPNTTIQQISNGNGNDIGILLEDQSYSTGVAFSFNDVECTLSGLSTQKPLRVRIIDYGYADAITGTYTNGCSWKYIIYEGGYNNTGTIKRSHKDFIDKGTTGTETFIGCLFGNANRGVETRFTSPGCTISDCTFSVSSDHSLINYGDISANSCSFYLGYPLHMGGYVDPLQPSLGRIHSNATFNDCFFSSNYSILMDYYPLGCGNYTFNNPIFSTPIYQPFDLGASGATLTIKGTPENKVDLTPLKGTSGTYYLVYMRSGTLNLIDCETKSIEGQHGMLYAVAFNNDLSSNISVNMDRCSWIQDSGHVYSGITTFGFGQGLSSQYSIVFEATNTVWLQGNRNYMPYLSFTGNWQVPSKISLNHCTMKSLTLVDTGYYLISGNNTQSVPPNMNRDSLIVNNSILDASGAYVAVSGFKSPQIQGSGNLVNLEGALGGFSGEYSDNFPSGFSSRLGDPSLNETGYLLSGSSALGGAFASNLNIDIENQSRPQGDIYPDIGADESNLVFTPTNPTLSLASHWIQPIDLGNPTKSTSHQNFNLLGVNFDPLGLNICSITIWVKNILGISDSEMFNPRLYWDTNSNGVVDDYDQFIANGISILSATDGIITFASPFFSKGELLVSMDFANLEPGDELTVTMTGSDVIYNGSQTLIGSIPGLRYVVNNPGEDNSLPDSSTNSKSWTLSYRSPGGTMVNGRYNLAGDRIILGYDSGSAWIYEASSNTPIMMLKDHYDKVRYAGFSSDDSSAVTVTRDGAIYIWNLETGAQVKSLFSDLLVTTAIPSPDFTKLMVITEGKALLMDLNFGRKLWEFIPGDAVINAVDYSPDGTRIIIGSSDKRAYILNAETGAEVRRLIGHSQQVTAVGFTGDGKKVLTSSTDAVAQLWNVASGPPVRSISLSSQQAQGATVSKDGNLIAMVTGLPNQSPQTPQQLRVFNQSGLELFAVNLDTESEGLWRGYLYTLAFSPDGSSVLVTSGEQSLSTSSTYGTGWCSACCFSSADGSFLRNWGPQGQFQGAYGYSSYPSGYISGMDKRPRVQQDGNRIFYMTNRGLQIVPIEPGKPIIDHPALGIYQSGTTVVHQSEAFGISNDGQILSWCGTRGSSVTGLQVDTVDSDGFHPMIKNRQINAYYGTSQFSLSPTGGRFAIGDRLFNTFTTNLYANYPGTDQYFQSAFSNDERLWGFTIPADKSVVTMKGNDPNATLYNMTLTDPYTPYKILYHPDQRRIGILDASKGVQFYDMDSGIPEGIYSFTGSYGEVANDAALSKDGSLLLLGYGNTVVLFEMKTGRILRYFYPLHSGYQSCSPCFVDFVDDDQKIVIAWSWNYVETYGRTEPVDLEISPTARTLAKGESQEFHVTAIYDDDTRADVSPDEYTNDQMATLVVIPETAATVNGSSITLSQTASGSFIVRALYRENGRNFTADAIVTVGDSHVISLVADPATLTLNPGVFRNIEYTAVFDDGYETDVTSQVVLSTTQTDTVDISDQSFMLNLITQPGEYTITGTLNWGTQQVSTETIATLYGHKTAWERYHVTAGGYGLSGGYSPDGLTLATGFSSGAVAFYSVGIVPSQYELQRILIAHDGQVVFCEYKDANTLVTVSDDGTIREWSADGYNPDPLYTFTHLYPINCAALQGDYLAFGDVNGSVGLYNLGTHTTDWVVTHHKGSVNSVSVNSDRVLSGGNDKEVKVLNRSDGSMIRSLQVHTKEVLSVGFMGTFAGADAFFSLGADKQLTLWNNSSFDVIDRYEYPVPPTTASFANGKLFVSTTQPVATRIYNSNGLLLRWLDHHPDIGGVKKHLVDPSGQFLVTGREKGLSLIQTSNVFMEKETYFSSFQFWEIGRGIFRGSLAHSYPVDDAHVDEYGEKLFTQDAKRTMSWVFDATTTQVQSQNVFETGYYIYPSFEGMDFTEDCQILATLVQPSIFMYNTFTDTLWKTLHTEVNTFTISPQGSRMATSGGGFTRLWDLTNLTLIHPETRICKSVDFRLEDNFVGVIQADQFLGIWNDNGFLFNGTSTKMTPFEINVNSTGTRCSVISITKGGGGDDDLGGLCPWDVYLETYDISNLEAEPALVSLLYQFTICAPPNSFGDCVLPNPKTCVSTSLDSSLVMAGSDMSDRVRLIRFNDGSTIKEFLPPTGPWSKGGSTNQGAAAVEFTNNDDTVMISWREGFVELQRRIRNYVLSLNVEQQTDKSQFAPLSIMKDTPGIVDVEPGDVIRIQTIAKYENGADLNVTSSARITADNTDQVDILVPEVHIKPNATAGFVILTVNYEEPGSSKNTTLTLRISGGVTPTPTIDPYAPTPTFTQTPTVTPTPIQAGCGEVRGLWNFDDASLRATVGYDLQFFGNADWNTQFGTTTSFGIPDIKGVPSNVMMVTAYGPTEGIAMFPDLSANGGGTRVNQYTLIMDLLYPSSSDATYRALLQTDATNSSDADLFVRGDSNGLGVSPSYHGVVTAGVWHRLAVSIDLTLPTMAKYIDGVYVGSQTLSQGVDGRWSLNPAGSGLATLLFTDNDSETNVGYVNSIAMVGCCMSAEDIIALGKASAGGVFGPHIAVSTETPTITFTDTPTESNTMTPVPTPSWTPTPTPSNTEPPTPTLTKTWTPTPSWTVSYTMTPQSTTTPTQTLTNTDTFTDTNTPTYTPTQPPTGTPSPTNTPGIPSDVEEWLRYD